MNNEPFNPNDLAKQMEALAKAMRSSNEALQSAIAAANEYKQASREYRDSLKSLREQYPHLGKIARLVLNPAAAGAGWLRAMYRKVFKRS